MLGDASDIIWGVMDVEVKTNFPDIMSKCLIHSKSDGSIMVIPREAGLVRLYVQLQAEAGPDGKQKHYGRDASEDICKSRARKIFEPFKLEFGKTAWFSVYRASLLILSLSPCRGLLVRRRRPSQTAHAPSSLCRDRPAHRLELHSRRARLPWRRRDPHALAQGRSGVRPALPPLLDLLKQEESTRASSLTSSLSSPAA